MLGRATARRRAAAPARQGRRPGAGAAAGRTVPFDYSFVFDLGADARRRQHRKTVTVSIEAAFVAVSVGYGLIPPPPQKFGLRRPGRDSRPEPAPVPAPSPSEAPTGSDSTSGLFEAASLSSTIGSPFATSLALAEPIRTVNLARVAFADVLSGFAPVATQATLSTLMSPLAVGIRLNPRLLARFDVADPDADIEIDAESAEELFELTTTPIEDVQFTYALFDDGSGREYQSEPVLSTAGLGMPKGERPFRYFATPIRFEPQTTIRMEVTEVTPFVGQLHVVLHGYKIVGGAAPTARRAARQRRFTRR